MNIEKFRMLCISKPGVEETFPFDETTLVFKVMGKMFALCNVIRGPEASGMRTATSKAITPKCVARQINPLQHC